MIRQIIHLSLFYDKFTFDFRYFIIIVYNTKKYTSHT